MPRSVLEHFHQECSLGCPTFAAYFAAKVGSADYINPEIALEGCFDRRSTQHDSEIIARPRAFLRLDFPANSRFGTECLLLICLDFMLSARRNDPFHSESYALGELWRASVGLFS